ncbi:MAG: RNA-guided pseudouridylation complex pseudouridine synthase subunit Cbf5 [Candidatus Altiarchaeales archaeon]|nr:RNA-guided pseudouridylation complex pseudouridine synthase subunit Cbf5 [Candidatus Altiarchaeales archaeon]MBD3416460.1 RNA-guided pseudouridylation complex pseudouridine synthase subunit Cbf5 [Candidatus Altiarchaeales archaeon]
MDGRILVKSEEEGSPDYGSPPCERPIEEYIRKGIVNIDKPSGPTSHQVTAWVKEMMGLKKAGHSGTLDPKVTGVLPVALEDGTKALQALLLSGKTYVTLMKLHGDTTNSQIKKTLSLFKGTIYQRPPQKCAVKRELRTRTIYSIQYIERDGPYVLFNVHCEAGTYIRKLCHDIGLLLGVGAHMQELRRIQAGPYTEDKLVSLHDLRDAWETRDEEQLRKLIQPMETMVDHLPKIWVKDSAVSALCHGAPLNAPGVAKLTDNIVEDDLTALFTLRDEIIGLAKALKDSASIMSLKKGEVASPERNVMHPDTYPQSWTSKNS